MKLAKAETPETPEEIPAQHREVSATQMREGDSVITMVTHQINVDGSEAWVRFGATTTIGAGETEGECKERAITYVQNGAMDAVKATVEKINEVQA